MAEEVPDEVPDEVLEEIPDYSLDEIPESTWAPESDDPLPASSYATSDVLWASAKVIASTCPAQNLAYLRCKKESMKPFHCLHQGKDVTQCVTNVLKKTDKQCPDVFLKYQICLDKTHGKYEKCRPEQTAFEACFYGES